MDHGIVRDGPERMWDALKSGVTTRYACRLAAASPRRRRAIEKVLHRKVAREWAKLGISGRTLW